MQIFLQNWIILIGIFAVALASPGPDFIMIIRNSLTQSRKTGVITAIGLGLGVAIHVSYCLGGLAVVISKSVLLFNILKFIGAGYLIYVGFKALKSKGFIPDPETEKFIPMSSLAALQSGFITNLFNPKATMFFLALFTQIMNPNVGLPIQIIYGLTCILMTMLWFSIVATVLTAPSVRQRFLKFSKWIDRTCGMIFIALGMKLAAATI